MNSDPKLLEEEAHRFLSEEKFDEAFRFFKMAAQIYKSQGNPQQASLCFASAASCWSIKSGEKTFYNAASCYEEAAREAEIFQDLEYASLLYKYAAKNYERDGEFQSFSECFYRSKECYRKFLLYSIFRPRQIHSLKGKKKYKDSFVARLFLLGVLNFSYLIWGHGERPSKTFYTAVGVILICAIFYTWGPLVKSGFIFMPSFWESLYFSITTFTNLGYGDITPVGVSKLMVALESFCGIFLMPLFIIGLSRKYLRI